MKQDRRTFILSSATASAAMFLSSLEAFASANKPLSSGNSGYDLKIMATNWGFAGSMDDFCSAVKKEGYDGVDLWWPNDKKAQDEMFAALKTHDLQVGFQCGGWQENPEEHLAFYKKMIDAAARQNIQRPLYINNHSGRVHFEWWDKVVELKKQKGEQMTFLTEFGPPDYMPTLPYTRQPLGDQWAINVYMMNLLRKRYS